MAGSVMEALGLIETKGLTALIEASDAMLKSANVTLIGWTKIGSGMVTAMWSATWRRSRPRSTPGPPPPAVSAR